VVAVDGDGTAETDAGAADGAGAGETDDLEAAEGELMTDFPISPNGQGAPD